MPSTARSPGLAMPSSRAMASPVSLWSPVTITGRMPARRHSATAAFTSSRGGSIWPTRPSRRTRPARASNPWAGSSSPSSTEPKASTRSAREAIASEAARAAAKVSWCMPLASLSTASGAPLTITVWHAPGRRWRVAISLASESNGSSVSRGDCSRSAARSMPALAARTRSAPSVGSPSTVQAARSSSGGASSASLHRAAAASRSCSDGSLVSAGRPSSSSSPCGA